MGGFVESASSKQIFRDGFKDRFRDEFRDRFTDAVTEPSPNLEVNITRKSKFSKLYFLKVTLKLCYIHSQKNKGVRLKNT